MNKRKAAFLSILSNLTLVLLKLVSGFMIGSISVISEALHSAIDMFASLVAFVSVSKAEKPADSDHPFGHGKFENLSAVIEAVLIIITAVYIIYEAAQHILSETVVSFPAAGLAVMFVSASANYFISSYLRKVAKETDSIALEADAKHLSVDVYSSLGVFAGMFLLMITGWHIIDAITAIVVGLFILIEGVMITRKSVNDLLDSALPEEEIEVIKSVIESKKNVIKGYSDLKTRKAGSERHIALHLTVCQNERIVETHKTMDNIEEELEERLNRCKVIIHPEPCVHNSEDCPVGCYWVEQNNNDKRSEN
ncbi:Cation efflux protein [Candidatus Magnetoovum chiemensis]|nr:Cation efflux protein [Candidatus Magnetoovum chiemensis]